MKKTLLRISMVVLVFTCVSSAYFARAHDAVKAQETAEAPVFDLKKDSTFDNGKLITAGNLTNEDGTIYSDDWTALLTAVEGGYEICEAGVAVTDQTIVYRCYKPTLFKKETQNVTQHPVKNHYYYDTEFENYVSLEKGTINCEHTLKMTRGSSEWTFSFVNYL